MFNCYNHVEAQVHRNAMPPELITPLSKRQQSLFRGVWRWTNQAQGTEQRNNKYYSVDNQAM